MQLSNTLQAMLSSMGGYYSDAGMTEEQRCSMLPPQVPKLNDSCNLQHHDGPVCRGRINWKVSLLNSTLHYVTHTNIIRLKTEPFLIIEHCGVPFDFKGEYLEIKKGDTHIAIVA